MKLTDTELLNVLDRPHLCEIKYRIANSDIEDMEDLSELEFVSREAEWVLDDYTEDTGHILHDDYLWAKRLLKKTDNGKKIPLLIVFEPTFQIKVQDGYSEADILCAKNIVEEVKATRSLVKQLQKIKNKRC